MTHSSPQETLVNLYLSEVICNSTKGSTLEDFLHTRTLNCQGKCDKFQELSKRMASECDVTSKQCRIYVSDKCFIAICGCGKELLYIHWHNKNDATLIESTSS